LTSFLLRPRRDLSVFRRSRVERGCRLRPKNPCERGGRLYAADRGDKIWTEADVARLLAAASREMELALWTGQRQGDLLTLPWSAYDGSHLRGAVVATAARIRRADALATEPLGNERWKGLLGGRPLSWWKKVSWKKEKIKCDLPSLTTKSRADVREIVAAAGRVEHGSA
jgi:hypothetical protein